MMAAKSAVYHGNSFLGEADIFPKNSKSGPWMRELRISHVSPPSDRCPPLAILHTIAPAGACFKIESSPAIPGGDSPLFSLYAACLRENKTAVVPFGEEELHLVAMPSRKNLMQYSCFWGFSVAPGLYNACLVMLNMRCLGIVFDLDETLIVANTMRSFEDRINILQQKLGSETDPERVAGMLAEVKRYQEDKSILKQYIENDQVVDNGKMFKVQAEIVQPLSDSHLPITRPIIRLQEKNIVLTRVNPVIRDTSVLVRLRPAWEDLRSYLTARGRKRFEVYVCTMAERDYALEMWRLLDPEANLINPKELLDRIVCVKPGTKKSLLNVFQDGICHPKMALVIDDRLKVWDEKDQPRVHVVPAYAPYYAPQAEANSTIPVLCFARNVACNVRGSFFKEFDEGLLPRIADIFFENENMDLPSPPDVGNYLISEDDTAASNGNKDPLFFDGMADAEVERRLKETNCVVQTVPPMVNNFDPRTIPSFQHVLASSSGPVPLAANQVMIPLPNNQCPQFIPSGKPLGQPESGLQCAPATEEGEVPESDLDPNTRRRLLILQHGQDTRDPPPPPPPPPPPTFPFRPPLQVSVPAMQPRGNWIPMEEEMNPIQLNRAHKEFPMEPEVLRFNKNQAHHPSLFRGGENRIPPDRVFHENQRLSFQPHHGDTLMRPNHPVSNYSTFPGEEIPTGRISSKHRDVNFEGRATAQYAESPVAALQEIAMKCGSKVEFRTALTDTTELQFVIEAWFVGEKLGEGIGRTRKEAQHRAAENSLQYLATFVRDDLVPVASTSESRYLDHGLEGSRKPAASVATLKELCIMEGYNLDFKPQSTPSTGPIDKGDVYAQVEIAGQILGKGYGTNWEEAKQQAAEEALETWQSMLGPFTHRRSGSPRSGPTTPNKRLKQDFPRALQRIPSSGRYSRNETPVP